MRTICQGQGWQPGATAPQRFGSCRCGARAALTRLPPPGEWVARGGMEMAAPHKPPCWRLVPEGLGEELDLDAGGRDTVHPKG